MKDYDFYLELHRFVITPDILSHITNQLDFISIEQQVRLYNFLLEYFNFEEEDE